MIVRGSTAVIQIDHNIIQKKVINYSNFNVFERELFWLQRFSNVDFIPNLLDYNKSNKTITMSNVGIHLTKDNKPFNFNEQLDNILNILKKYNCSHNDINLTNILIKDNKITLIDFGWATYISDENEIHDEFFNLNSVENKKKFPNVLNAKYRINGELNDEYAIKKVKTLI